MVGQWHEGGNGWEIAFMKWLVNGTTDHILEFQDYIVKWLASGMAELYLNTKIALWIGWPMAWIGNGWEITPLIQWLPLGCWWQ